MSTTTNGSTYGGDSPELRTEDTIIPYSKDLPQLDIDLEYIRKVVLVEDGQSLVAEHHKNLFRSANSEIEERHSHLLSYESEREIEIVSEKNKVFALLKNTSEFLKDYSQKGKIPWNVVSRITSWFLVSFTIVLLIISTNTLATYLMSSGMLVFIESPFLAYLLSAVNIGIAALLKIFYYWQKDISNKVRYFRQVWWVGSLSGLVWLITFSMIFPSLGTTDLDEVLSEFSEVSVFSSSMLQFIFVCSQLVAEICIAAVMWIHLQRMVDDHFLPLTMHKNPEYEAYASRLAKYREEIRTVNEAKTHSGGLVRAIRAKEAAYISKAVSHWLSERGHMVERKQMALNNN